MAEKDKIEKVLEDYNDVFADIYNTLLFEEPLLEEDKLEFGPTESIYKSESGELKEQRRDVLKIYRDNNFLLCSFGAENQSTIDKYMPVRIMGYDYATYRKMLDTKKEIAPVITIVLNFTDKRWNESQSLYELLNIPEKLKPFVQDYKIRVFDIAYLEDDVIDRFTSDFKLIAKFFKKKREGYGVDVLTDATIPLKHLEATLNMLRVFSNDERYLESYTAEVKQKVEKGELVFMCEVIDMIEKRGIEQGIKQELFALVKKGLLKVEDAANEICVTVEEFQTMMSEEE